MYEQQEQRGAVTPLYPVLCYPLSVFKECLDNLDNLNYQPDNFKDSLDLAQHIYSFLW